MESDNKKDRKLDRRRMLKSGLICFNKRHSVLPCTVRDLSENGAKLITPDPSIVPAEFELNIELDGIWATCRSVWNSKDVLGVEFILPIQFGEPRRKQTLLATAQQRNDTKSITKNLTSTPNSSAKVERKKLLNGKKILIVDDDPIFCKLANLALSKVGAQVLTANSGYDALNLMENNVFDAATIDLIMPEMDGFRLIALMRHSSKTRHLPIVVVTSRFDSQAIHEAQILNVTAHKLKPIDWPDLAETLNIIIGLSVKEIDSRKKSAIAAA